VKSLFFYPAESAAAFLFCQDKGPAIRERIKEQCIMQQATINFTAQQVRARVSLADMVVAAVCVEQNPLVSITAMGVSGWIVYRLNKGEKGGQA